MRPVQWAIAFAALTVPGVAAAQAPAAPASTTDERRLTPEQVEAILAEAARKRQASESRFDPEADEPAPRPQVHGEVGFAFGTGGFREVFGTAIAPLGEEGAAAISLDYVDWGKRRFKR